MPPTWNNIFVKTGKKGRRPYTEEAVAYMKHVKDVVGHQALEVGALIPQGSHYMPVIYGIQVVLYMNKLENLEWFRKEVWGPRSKKAGELKVKLRYKEVDTDNRLKFLKDQLTSAVGFQSDSIIFEDHVAKKQTNGPEHAIARIYVLDRRDFLPDAPDMVDV